MKQKRLQTNTVEKKLKELEIVGIKDISEMLHWGAPKVTTYISRDKHFPQQVGEVSGRPVWYKPDVIEWARSKGHKLYESVEDWEDPYKKREKEKLAKKKARSLVTA
jgi:hypothetical protein